MSQKSTSAKTDKQGSKEKTESTKEKSEVQEDIKVSSFKNHQLYENSIQKLNDNFQMVETFQTCESNINDNE